MVELVPHRVFGDAIERASDQVTKRVAAKYISAQKHHVDHRGDGSDTNPEAVGETGGG